MRATVCRFHLPFALLGAASSALLLAAVGQAQPQTLHERAVLQQPAGDANPGDAFGRALATWGDRLVVGAPGDDERGTDAGAAYIYVRLNGRWQFEAKLAPEDLRAGDAFGTSVSIDVDCIAVGAPGDDRNLNEAGLQVGTVIDRGAAYVFRLRKANWRQEARLQPQALPGDDPAILIGAGDAFGSSVAVLHRRVVVGAPLTDHQTSTMWGVATDAGAAYVYDLSISWYLADRFWIASGQYFFGRNARFGASIIFDIPGDDNNIVIGMPFVGELSPGVAYRFTNFVSPQGASDWRPTFDYTASRAELPPGLSEGVGFNAYANGHLVATPTELRVASDSAIHALTPGGRLTLRAAAVVRPTMYQSRAVWTTDLREFRYSPTHLFSLAPGGGEVLLAGSDVSGAVDGTGSQARFYSITSAIPDDAGGFYVIDGTTIRHVDASGVVVTLCGHHGSLAADDGVGPAAGLWHPRELTWNAADSSLYFLDGSALRVMRPSTAVITLVGSAVDSGSTDGHGTSARLTPTSFAIAPGGGFMIGEERGLRRVSAGLDVSTVITTAGEGERIVDGTQGTARFLWITSLAYGQDGLLYFIDGNTARTLSDTAAVTTIVGMPLSDVLAPSEYGASLASDGTNLLVGAPRMSPPTTPSTETSGVVWALRTTQPGNPYRGMRYPIFPAARVSNMRFGASVAIADGRAFVGTVNAAGTIFPVMAFERDADNVWTHALSFTTRAPMGPEFGSSLAVSGTDVFVGAPQDNYTISGFVAVFSLADRDSDNDGMPDGWETQFGLDPASSTGVNGAGGDKDGDGATNLAEYSAQTHPNANATLARYFAEGATTWQFGTWIFLANPGSDTATAQLRFLRGDGTVRSHVVSVPGMTMQYVAVQDLPDMLDQEFATTIESDQLIVADRAVWWPRSPEGNAYGSHAERAVTAPATTWYFAEGATHSGFDLFYLLQNPNETGIDVIVRYLRPVGDPLEKTYHLPALSRTTIWVNHEMFDRGSGPEALLASTDVAAVVIGFTPPAIPVHSPFIAERALYRAGPNGRQFEAGHESAGVTAPATDWFFAEGATGDMFDTFVLVANPNASATRVRVTYLLDDGRTFTRDLAVGSNARSNIWADVESFDGGVTFPLANAAFSTTLISLDGQSFVAERSMWWPGPSHTTWHEAHNSFGSTETGTKWVAAFGHVPIALSSATYLLIANPGDTAATVQVTRLNAGGPSPTQTFTVAPHSRFNVEFNGFTMSGPGFFGAIVESVGSPAAPIVVERATYSTELGGTQWPAGTAALLTKIQ